MGLGRSRVRAARTNTRGMSIVDRNNKRIGEMRAGRRRGRSDRRDRDSAWRHLRVFYRATEG